MVAAFDNTMFKPRKLAASIPRLECTFAIVGYGVDQLASIDRLGNLSRGMRTALFVIGIEQLRPGRAMGDGCEFPCQVLGIAHTAAHALAIKRWHLVGSIASQKDRAVAEAVSHDTMKSVRRDTVYL
jgi:hypothetical protein